MSESSKEKIEALLREEPKEKKVEEVEAAPQEKEDEPISKKQIHSIRLNFALRAMESYLQHYLTRNNTVEFGHWLESTKPDILRLADVMTEALTTNVRDRK